MLKTILFSLCLLIFPFVMTAQCSTTFEVTSSDGYTVHVEIQMKGIVPSLNPCADGYNYNVSYDYDIVFSGTNIPSSLWTLQGNLPCGSNTNNFFDLPNSSGKGSGISVGNIWRNETDCGISTPMSLSCDVVTLIIQGPGINANSILTINESCDHAATPLPVEWLDFSVENAISHIDLNWSTASELNNAYFDVQKSTDGLNWDRIGRVEGSGTTSLRSEYNFIDKSFNQSTVVYYRILQVDTDGRSAFSSIQSLRMAPVQWSIFPNPTKEQTWLKSEEKVSVNDLRIFDFMGREVHAKTEMEQIGDHDILINTSGWTSGVYFLSMKGANHKLIVQ